MAGGSGSSRLQKLPAFQDKCPLFARGHGAGGRNSVAERRCVGSVRLAPRATIHLKYSARFPNTELVKELLLDGIEEIATRAGPGPMP